ncbi:MAG TPA: hypothetical protein ENK30_02035 [Anaerolineae bacterium]|nr:hypothetical protein [Anaerolineae bacterium]
MKPPSFFLTGALVALLALVVLGAAALAQSSMSFDLSWHSVDGGGGESSSASYQLSGAIGQADAGSHASASFKLTGGFLQGTFPPGQPQTVADLTIANNAGSAQLTWSAITQDTAGNALANVTYNVYRAIGDPYFTPGAAYASGLTTTSYTDPDTTVLTDADNNAFYLVRAQASGREGDDSNRVGTFNFDLTPGAP